MCSYFYNTSGRTEEEVCIGGLLLRHILQLVCNAHAITELQVNFCWKYAQLLQIHDYIIADFNSNHALFYNKALKIEMYLLIICYAPL